MLVRWQDKNNLLQLCRTGSVWGPIPVWNKSRKEGHLNDKSSASALISQVWCIAMFAFLSQTLSHFYILARWWPNTLGTQVCPSVHMYVCPSTKSLSDFWVTVSKAVSPMLSDHCLSCLSVCPVCNVGVLWPNSWTDQDKTWHAGRPGPWPHCVRWAPSSSSPKGGQSPNFRSI